MRRIFLLVALSACASDPPPPEREPHVVAVRARSAAQQGEDDALAYQRAKEAREAAAENARQAESQRIIAQAQADQKDRERVEAERRAELARQEAAAKAKHESDCKASYGSRLIMLQAQINAAITKKTQLENRCRALQPRCTIIRGEHSVCSGVSADDAQLFESTCMVLPYGDQILLVDETSDCAELDALPLHITMKTTSAELDALRRAKP